MKALLLPFLLLLAAPLGAQTAAPSVELTSDVKLERTVIVEGAERTELVEPDVVVPGDRLVFTTRYRNVGTAPVENFAITNALPGAVQLAEATPDLVVSIDGAKTWGRLAELRVANPDGTTRPASAGDVSHIRWTIPRIDPGVSNQVQYRAVVR